MRLRSQPWFWKRLWDGHWPSLSSPGIVDSLLLALPYSEAERWAAFAGERRREYRTEIEALYGWLGMWLPEVSVAADRARVIQMKSPKKQDSYVRGGGLPFPHKKKGGGHPPAGGKNGYSGGRD